MASLAEEELQKIIKELYLDRVDEEALYKKIMSCDFNTANVIVDILFDVYSRAKKIYEEKKETLGLETEHSKDFEFNILRQTAFIYVEPYIEVHGLQKFLNALNKMKKLEIIFTWERWQEKGQHYDYFPTKDEIKILTKLKPGLESDDEYYSYLDCHLKEEELLKNRYLSPYELGYSYTDEYGNVGVTYDTDFKRGVNEFDLVKFSLPYSLSTREERQRKAERGRLEENKKPEQSLENPTDVKKMFDEIANPFSKTNIAKTLEQHEEMYESIFLSPHNTIWLDFFKNYTYEDFGLAGYGVPKFSYNEDSSTILYGVKKKRLKDGWQKTLFDLIYYETTRKDKLVRIPFYRFIEEMEERGFEDGYGESEEGDKAILKKYDDNIYQLNKTLNKEFGFKDLKIISLSQHTKVITFEDKALLDDLLG